MERVGGPSKLSQEEPAPPGTEIPLPQGTASPSTPNVISSKKGVENAKKRLRAFSIQKKSSFTPIVVPKAIGSGNTTVLIGKLSGVKVTPKVEDPEQKKLPKPPKPGTLRKSIQDSHTDLQKRTLSEIEDMKRKMELVELGIPLGLICPTSTSEKAMPTKAMPPIKSFLDPAKVDELIREAKKAKQEGKAFKFDYQKLLPDYDNPFQRKKEEAGSHDKEKKSDRRTSEPEKDKDRRKSDKYDSRRHDYRRDDKYKERDRDKTKEKSRAKEHKTEESKNTEKPSDREADVNLNDYLVCDSWSLDNDDKNNSSSPKVQDKTTSVASISAPVIEAKVNEPSEQLKASIAKRDEIFKNCTLDSPRNAPTKIEKLKPVIDSFKYEIDSNDDEILDIFDEDSGLDKFAQQTNTKKQSNYDSRKNVIDYEPDISKDGSLDGCNDDTFLESVINEIKQEEMSDGDSQEKGLVEYDISPNRDEDISNKSKRGSVTPELDDKIRNQSQRSDYSEGYRSSDSYKTADTSESGYKSVESFRLSVEKDLDEALESKMSKSTVDSLETWSFVLKICQPLLFRHDKNKCYKETRSVPKIWFTENPKTCFCVKDRSVVYEELEMCKMSLVDRVYGCDQIPDSPFPTTRNWYPRSQLGGESNTLPLTNEWEAEDSQQAERRESRRPCTPQKNDELSLDREYQRFMEAVWPDVVDSKPETSRSTTPVRQESRKKKKEDTEREMEDKKAKKIKLSSEGWSQESELEEEADTSKKLKVQKEKVKSRKRKHSVSTMSSSLSDSDSDSKKKKLKKKAIKKTKSKSAKRRRMGRKLLKKLKEKQKKKRKQAKDSDEDESDKKKDKKSKKKKQLKAKKKAQKKKKAKAKSSSSSSSSSSDSSDSDSESDRKSKKAKRKEQGTKKNKAKKQRKESSSDSHSEDLFDVNILKNIKTERLTDDEKTQKMMEFSPRRQKPREIINVKELQNDFVGIHIKQEVEEEIPKEVPEQVVKEIPKDIPMEVPEDIPQDTPKDIPKEAPKELTKEIANEDSEVIQQADEPDLAEIVLPKEKINEQETEKELPKQLPEPVLVDLSVSSIPVPPPDESNMSQCSSQESVCSVKEIPMYEKDESHLRPSSQNSNYSFNDVISANSLYQKGMDECEDNGEGYEANYEMYEQLAMAYQSDVASQRASPPRGGSPRRERRIETVVRARSRGEIKCDWRAGDERAPAAPRPSRWGLKPGEVNIVLTGGSEPESPQPQSQPQSQPVYHIESLANRTDASGYDEAYMDMYGASDRLQYGDCFSTELPASSSDITLSNTGETSQSANISIVTNANVSTSENRRSLDARIDQALRETVLGEVAKEREPAEPDKDAPEKGILITSVSAEGRGSKRVSFADGYKPGQDSDVEEPPVKKRKKRRHGCAWPCPAGHADHVPLWDALPPPPPPPGSPPPPPARGAPTALLRAPLRPEFVGPAQAFKFDPAVPLPGFMPPEPPPGLLSLPKLG